MKNLMTWSLIVASFGLTGCKSLQDYLNDAKAEDQKAVVQPKEAPVAPKAKDKAAAPSAPAATKVATVNKLQARPVGYGYSAPEAPAEEEPADSAAKKPVDPKADAAAKKVSDAAAAPTAPAVKKPVDAAAKKVSDAPDANEKKPIGPDAKKPVSEEATPAPAAQLKSNKASLKKVDNVVEAPAVDKDAAKKAADQKAKEQNDAVAEMEDDEE